METSICCWVQRGPWIRYAEAQALAMVAHNGELLVLCNGNCNRMVCESLATLVRNGIQQLGGREWERRKGNLLV